MRDRQLQNARENVPTDLPPETFEVRAVNAPAVPSKAKTCSGNCENCRPADKLLEALDPERVTR